MDFDDGIPCDLSFIELSGIENHSEMYKNELVTTYKV